MWKWLLVAVQFGGALVKALTGKKASMTDILKLALNNLLPSVEAAIQNGANTKELFDAWLDELDARTGTDVGAFDIIKDMPADKEEEFFDHLKEMARLYGYCKLELPGFHE